MFAFVCIAFILLDQLSKGIVSKLMELNQSIVLIPKVLELCYIHNDGAAYGIFSGKQLLLIISTAILILALLGYVIKAGKDLPVLEKVSLAMIIGGGVGNLISRIAFGYVVDFLNIYLIPIFNVADIGITCGCVLMLVSVFTEKKHGKA